MAETNIRYDPDGNRYRYNYGRDRWEPIGDDFGAGGTFKNAARNAVERLGAGIIQPAIALDGYGARTFGDDQDVADNEALRQGVADAVLASDERLRMSGGDLYPLANFAGQAAPYAVGGLAGGATRLGTTMAAEAGLGAMAYGSPGERALNGALGAVGGGAGNLAARGAGALVGGIRGRGNSTMAERVANGIAQASEDASDQAASYNVKEGLRLAEGAGPRALAEKVGPGGSSGAEDMAAGGKLRQAAEARFFPDAQPNAEIIRAADDVGIKLTPGQRRGSRGQQTVEEAMMRDPAAGAVFAREFAEPNQDLVTEKLRRAGGLDEGTTISMDDYTKMSDAISEEFTDIAREIPNKYKIIDDDVKQMVNITNTIQDAVRRKDTQNRWVKPWLDELEGNTISAGVPFAEPKVGASDMWGIIRDINESINTDNLGSTQREALESLREFWEFRLENMARSNGKPDIMGRIKNVNEKYRVQKLVQSSGVLRGGEVNIRALANRASQQFKETMMRNDYTDARGRPLERATTDLIKALQVVRAYPNTLGNSGTPTGQMFNNGLLKGVEKMARSQAGAEMYVGNLGKSAKSAAMVPASVLLNMASGGRL